MHVRHKLSRHRRIVLAGLTAAATTVALAAVPSTFAAGSSTGSSAVQGNRMYSIAVRAASGEGVALATRLNNAGYDVMSVDGAIVRVLGTEQTEQRLRGLAGASVVGRRAAAPTGPIPKAPASQDNVLPKRLHGKTYPTFYGGYRTAVGYQQFESDLVDAYPNLVQEVTYGSSFTGGNPLNAVCITADAQNSCQLTPDVKKARFLVMAQIHAREIATSEMAWRFMTRLIDGWKHNAQITSLLQSTEIWVVPQVNPDGIQTVEQGIEDDGTGADSPAYQRKNMDEEQTPPGGCGGTWEFSQPGVDLNRNYTYKWGGQGTSEDPCDQEYLGTEPASESEDSDLMGLFSELFKDQRGDGPNDPAPAKATGAMVTLHTVAGLVLLPWSYDSRVKAPNDAALRSLAFRQNYYNHYTAGESGEVLYNAAGTADDWTYATLGIASFTWELDGSGSCEGTFLPAYSCMDAYEANNLPGLFYDAAAARTPYKLSLGPTVLAAKTKSSGSSVKVTMDASDAAYGTSGVGRPASQNVKSARIFVGKAPWAHGATSSPMTIHGSGTSVSATVTVDKRAKKVLAWVQAKDASGNWGPARAVWIRKA